MEAEDFQDFKTNVKQFVELDEQIKDAQNDLKKVRIKHSELKHNLIEYMHRNDIETCTIMGGTEQLNLMYKKSKVKPKKEEIEQKMCKMLKMSAADAEKLYAYLHESSEEKRRKRRRR
jgi:hypothetical protein